MTERPLPSPRTSGRLGSFVAPGKSSFKCDCYVTQTSLRSSLSVIRVSQTNSSLVRLFRVVRRCLNPTGQFCLPFFFLIGLLAGINRCCYGAGLARRGLASRLGHVADLFSRLR